MEALIEPINNIGRRVKWGLAVHTMALFLFLAIHLTMDLHLLSTGYVDNRRFPGAGPVGYNDRANFSTAFVVIDTAMFPMSQWLVDGLLVSNFRFKLTRLCLTRFIPPAVSLLCHLFHESPDHGSPMPNLCCLCRCVPNSFAVNVMVVLSANSPTQRRVSRLSMKSRVTLLLYQAPSLHTTQFAFRSISFSHS